MNGNIEACLMACDRQRIQAAKEASALRDKLTEDQRAVMAYANQAIDLVGKSLELIGGLCEKFGLVEQRTKTANMRKAAGPRAKII